MDPNLTVREQILEHGITLTMLRWHNGFSYRALSAPVEGEMSEAMSKTPQ
jgi:hypothetical protein